MKDYLKLIRVKHWLKNALILLPIFFSNNLFNTNLLIKCLIAVLIFSLSSSIVYIINDLNDIEKDKNHPIKKNRPLASGRISKNKALIVIGIISILTIILMTYLYQTTNNLLIILIPIIYILLNILYSISFKDIPILDVVILVSGFVLRIMYGGEATCVEVSKYLYLVVIFGSFYLGFGKRRNEIIKNGDKSRNVLKYYTKDFLDKNMYVALALAVVSYTLWCTDISTINRIGNDLVFWTIPLLLVILQLYSLNIEGNSHGDPIEVILSDKKLLITGIVYAIIMVLIIYVI